MWLDGKLYYAKQDDGNWRKSNLGPMKVALRRLCGSQNMSNKYLNEVYVII